MISHALRFFTDDEFIELKQKSDRFASNKHVNPK